MGIKTIVTLVTQNDSCARKLPNNYVGDFSQKTLYYLTSKVSLHILSKIISMFQINWYGPYDSIRDAVLKYESHFSIIPIKNRSSVPFLYFILVYLHIHTNLYNLKKGKSTSLASDLNNWIIDGKLLKLLTYQLKEWKIFSYLF